MSANNRCTAFEMMHEEKPWSKLVASAAKKQNRRNVCNSRSRPSRMPDDLDRWSGARRTKCSGAKLRHRRRPARRDSSK